MKQLSSRPESPDAPDLAAGKPIRSSDSPNYLRIAAIGLISLIVLVIVVLFARRMLYLNVWSYLSNKMIGGWNLNQDLAKAIAAVVWLPFFYFFVASLSLKKNRRYLGLIGLSVYVSTFFAVAWAANQDTHFSETHGKPWVAFTPEGCIYSDQAGRDLTYGRDRVRVTPAIVDACMAMAKGEDTCHRSLDEIPLLFNPSSNEPLVWYTRYSAGEYCFYLSPGFDPATGVRRAPLNPSTVQRIRDEISRREEEIAAKDAEGRRREAARQDSIREHQRKLAEARAEKEKLQKRISYWNRLVYVDALLGSQSRPAVFVAARNNGHGAVSFEEHLATELQNSGVRTSRLLRSGAYDTDLFSQLRSADLSLIRDLALEDSRSFFLVVDVDVKSPRQSSISNTQVFETEMEVFGRLVSFDGRANEAISVVSPGAGFNRDAAIQQARTRSIKKLVKEIN